MPGSYAIDPYFMQAYQWNPQSYYGATSVPQGYVPQQQKVEVPVAGTDKKKEEKSSNTGWTLAAAGATALTAYACFKGKGNPIKGAENIWNTVKTKLPKPKELMLTQNESGQWVCKLPGKKNILRGENTNVLENLGSSTNIPAVIGTDGKLAQGIKLRDYTFEYNGDTFRVVKGKLVKATNSAGKIYNLDAAAVDYQRTIKDLVAKYNRGENFSNLRNVAYSHTENGISRLFRDGGLQGAVTDRFHIDQPAVQAYRTRNPKADEAIKAVLDGKYDKFKVTEAIYPTAIGKIHIKNNEIVGFTPNGKDFCRVNSDQYGSYVFNNKEIFENVFKNKDSFTNKVYAMAV